MKKNQEHLKRFNIQAFAEPPVDDSGDKPVVITQADLDKARAEATKYKLANDKLSHENSEYKKSQKEKLSAEEKAKLVQEEKDKKIVDLEKSLNNERVSKVLAVGGFANEESTKFLDALNNENPVDRASQIVEIINEKVKQALDKAKLEFNSSSYIPNGKGSEIEKNSGLEEMFNDTH